MCFDASLFSTTERPDGSMQLTVNDQPLYRYAADAAPGDITGQDVGGVWFAAAPDGTPITAAASSSDSSDSDSGSSGSDGGY